MNATGLLLLLKLVSLFSFSLLEEEDKEVEEEAANTHRRNTLGSTAAPDSALVNLAKHTFDVSLFISLAYSSNAVVCVHTAPALFPKRKEERRDETTVTSEEQREKLESAEEDIIFAQGSAISVLFLSYFSLSRA